MGYVEMLIGEFEKDYLGVFTHWGETVPISEAKRDVVEMLKYLPKEVLANVYNHHDEIILAMPKTVGEFMEEAGRCGLLKFKPYVVWDCKVPMLVLRYKRYVHLFRGYHYQVSYTPSGVGEYRSAGIRIDQYRGLAEIKELRQSKFMQAAYYMNCIAACTGIDEFDNLLKDNPEVVDEFVSKSTKAAGIFSMYDMTYSELSSYIIPSDVVLEMDLLKNGSEYYRVPARETVDYVRVVIDRNKANITFITPTSFDAPKMLTIDSRLIGNFIGIAKEYDDEENTDESMGDALSVINNNMTYEMLVTFGLNILGFVANYTNIYPAGDSRRKALRSVDTSDIVALEDISAIQPKVDNSVTTEQQAEVRPESYGLRVEDTADTERIVVTSTAVLRKMDQIGEITVPRERALASLKLFSLIGNGLWYANIDDNVYHEAKMMCEVYDNPGHNVKDEEVYDKIKKAVFELRALIHSSAFDGLSYEVPKSTWDSII